MPILVVMNMVLPMIENGLESELQIFWAILAIAIG
jgi:hypothetical protein